MQTETIKYGEFFEIKFATEKIEIKSLRTDKINAENIILLTTEAYDANVGDEPVLDVEVFSDEPDWRLRIRAVILQSDAGGLVELGNYKKVIGEAQKLIDFMYENHDNFLEKIGLSVKHEI